jgi:hypothetical protein
MIASNYFVVHAIAYGTDLINMHHAHWYFCQAAFVYKVEAQGPEAKLCFILLPEYWLT